MTNNFFAELLQRLFSNNPKFFKYVQAISAIIALVTGLPGFLESAGIVLPDWATALESKVAAIAAVITMLIAQLPKQDGSKS